MKIIIVIKYKNKYKYNIKICILYILKKYDNLINTLYLSVTLKKKKKKKLFKI